MGNIDYEFGGDFVLEPCSLFTGCHAWKVEISDYSAIRGEEFSLPAIII